MIVIFLTNIKLHLQTNDGVSNGRKDVVYR